MIDFLYFHQLEKEKQDREEREERERLEAQERAKNLEEWVRLCQLLLNLGLKISFGLILIKPNTLRIFPRLN